MSSKAMSSSSPETPVALQLSQSSVMSDKSRAAMAVGGVVLRSVEAAQLFEFSPDAMVLVDATGRIKLVNNQTEKMFGYRREELVGEPAEKLIPERFRSMHVQHRTRYSTAAH